MKLHTCKIRQIVIVIVYLVGIVGLSFPASRSFFQQLTPLNLLFGVFILALCHQKKDSRQYIYFIWVLVGGFLIEWIGVSTGLVFGSYAYGQALGIKIIGTPLTIGINWLMLIYMVYHFLQGLPAAGWVKSLLGSFLMVGYDLLLEPVAIKLDFWHWTGGVIPLQNYVAWFFISFVFLLTWNIGKINFQNKVATVLLVTQLGFFLLLNLIL